MPKFASYFLTVDRIFLSTEKSQKIWSTENETFNQLKKDNFDQVKFGLTTPCKKFGVATCVALLAICHI